jgi:hypothetical protein
MTRPATNHERSHLMKEMTKTGSIELGTVGWDDGGDHWDSVAGEPTLVKVRLFRGRNPTTDGDAKTTEAQGSRLLCRISQPLNFIPDAGTQVIVGVPAGFGRTPGASMILGAAGNAPAIQFSETRAKMDFGANMDLLIKARSVTLTDYADRYVTVGPNFGIKMGDAVGNGLNLTGNSWLMYASDGDTDNPDARAVLQLDEATGVRLLHKKADGVLTSLVMLDGDATLAGTNGYFYVAGVYLGLGAIAANGAMFAGAGVSTTVYVSP